MIIYTYEVKNIKVTICLIIRVRFVHAIVLLCKKATGSKIIRLVCSWSENYLLKVSFPRQVIIFTKTVLLRRVVKCNAT